tara:strand:+ start:302 stop:502 length:201 start_codon:yes stop_codon:yes gene_type:complete
MKLKELIANSKDPNLKVYLEKLEKHGIIDARQVFKEKRRQDEWWRGVFERADKTRKQVEMIKEMLC